MDLTFDVWLSRSIYIVCLWNGTVGSRALNYREYVQLHVIAQCDDRKAVETPIC